MGRFLRCLAVAITLLTCVGCAVMESSKKPSLSFGKQREDESLRKKVEADSFPSAVQAGV